MLLQGLEQQSIEARQALESEIQQLQQAKRSAKAAQQAAQQSLNHVQGVCFNDATKANKSLSSVDILCFSTGRNK